ncbi:MAG: hypothetical protein U5K73_09575 [Halofilum sp. (in: g-proteobacteria)]|nr:hypothetical protein [Halofilum sp. (in: g-proteobacteria)]
MRKISTPIRDYSVDGGLSLGYQRLLIVPVIIVILGGLYLFLTRTRLGKAMRACAQDAEVASLYGININWIAVLSMVLAGAMAGLRGRDDGADRR